MVDSLKRHQEGVSEKRSQVLVVAAALMALLNVGCSSATNPVGTRQVQESTDQAFNPGDGKQSSGLQMMKFDLNRHPMTKTVCDPFDNGTTTDPEMGVKASLFYRGAGQPRWYTAQEYIDKGVASPQTLFFSDLFVPTRMFSAGFATQASETVKDDSGSQLIEYFALKFETQLTLAPDDPEGDYELSNLSDDGSIVRLKIDGVWQTIISNDGDHSTKMGCSQTLVPMTRGKSYPMEILYYQGPRFHISHVLMWRLSHSAQLGKDKECGKMGNNYYFDVNNGSAPLAAYNGLLARDWRPLRPSNYMISAGEVFNPCVQAAQNPVVSNFMVEEITAINATVSWVTDIPATSQVLYNVKGTSAQEITASDNLLRTQHRVQINGLTPGTTYLLQAVSTGEALGKGVSEVLEATTFALEQ